MRGQLSDGGESALHDERPEKNVLPLKTDNARDEIKMTSAPGFSRSKSPGSGGSASG
jgi:hypothetical protein